MSLIKAKQLDLVNLAEELANTINSNTYLRLIWASILNNTFLTAVFSLANSNITPGQSNFIVNYSEEPLSIFVYRNGSKLIQDTEYTITPDTGFFMITLVDPVGNSNGALFSEIIEINYY